jgi:hypothetical protein
MHWPFVLASANLLREGQRFVRPSRKDTGRHLCGSRDGVFEFSRAKPGAQLEAFIAETEHSDWLGAEVDGCELNGRFVGHGPFPLMRGPLVGMIGQGCSRAPPSFAAFIVRPLHSASVDDNPSLFGIGVRSPFSKSQTVTKRAGTPARDREFADSPLEQAGFELVWGFSCQVVVLGFAESSLFGAGKPFFIPSPAIRFAERAEGVKGPKR